MASTVSRQKFNNIKYAKQGTTLFKTPLALEKYSHLKDTLVDINKFTQKRNKLTDFEHLMTLVGDGILNTNAHPSEALINLSNYLGLEHNKTLSSLRKAWGKFFFRDAITGQAIERWDLQNLGLGKEWEAPRSTLLEYIGDTGLFTPRYPRYNSYDSLIIHGARLEDIMPRLRFVAELWQRDVRFNRIIVLTGERKLTACELDQNNWLFLPYRQTHQNNIVSEIELMQYAWQINNIIPPEVRELPIVWVDTPNFISPTGQEQRGITEDTINAWLDEHLSEAFDSHRCLAVANAPLILRQHVVFERKLHERKSKKSLETVGVGQENSSQLVVYYLREIAGLLWELEKFADMLAC